MFVAGKNCRLNCVTLSSRFLGHEISSVQFLGRTGSHLAIASEDCRIGIIDAERMQLLTKISFDKEGEGQPVDIIAVNNLLYVLTHHNNIFCLDCRLFIRNF